MEIMMKMMFDAALAALLPVLAGFAAMAANEARNYYLEKTRTSKSFALFDAAMRQAATRIDPAAPAFTERDVMDVTNYLQRTFAGSIRTIGATDEGVRGVVLSAFAKAMQERAVPTLPTYTPG